MNIFIIQHNFRHNYLVVIDNNIVNVYKYRYNFGEPDISFQPKHIFVGKSRICTMTEHSRSINHPEFDGNTVLLEFEDNEYV